MHKGVGLLVFVLYKCNGNAIAMVLTSYLSRAIVVKLGYVL